MTITRKPALFFSLTALTAGCLTVLVAGCRSTSAATEGRDRPKIDQVILIGVDGLGANYIPWDRVPNIRALRDSGIYTVARNCYPTSSAANWATALMGTTTDMHGYRKWNSTKPDVEPAAPVGDYGIPQCIFAEIRRQRPTAYTAATYNWGGIPYCFATNAISEKAVFCPRADDEGRETDHFLTYLAKKPTLGFLYYDSVDGAGHKFGWGTPEYIAAAEAVDRQIGRVLKAIADSPLASRTAVILIADHGGIGKSHGADVVECYRIPFIVSFPGVKEWTFRQPVMLADTAPTIAWLLGLEIPEVWRGRPVLK